MTAFAFYSGPSGFESAQTAAQLVSCGRPGHPDIVCVFDAGTEESSGTPRYGLRGDGLFLPDVVSVWAGGVEQVIDRESIQGMVQT